MPAGTLTATVEIHGGLTENDNIGLAFFSYDLRVVGPEPVHLASAAVFEPPLEVVAGPIGEQPDVYTFHVPDGFSILIDGVEELFNGAPIGNDLVQLGGGQNTINNDPNEPPFIPYPSGPVILYVGHGDGITMHKFDLTLPTGSLIGDVYVLEPFNVVANMITANGSLLGPTNDTVLSVYEACGGAEMACDDNGGEGLLSELTFYGTADTTYFIRVAGGGDNVGEIALEVSTIGRCIRLAVPERVR